MKSKIKHKILAVVCVVCLVFAAAVVAVRAAQPNPVFTVNGASQLHPGEEVNVAVTVNNNKGYCAAEFVLSYDSDVLTPVGVEAGDAASEYFSANPNYADGKVYFTVIDDSLMTAGGTVANIRFKVDENVVLYSGDLNLKVSSIVGNVVFGYSFLPVKATVAPGEIHAAKQIFVPDAADPTKDEQLSVKADSGRYVIGATTYANLTQAELADNFGSLKVEFFSANGAALSTSALLSTGCRIKVVDGDTSNTLVMSVKGDVDGNLSKDANDAFLVGMFESGMLSADNADTAYADAADINGDGVVDSSDFNAAMTESLK